MSSHLRLVGGGEGPASPRSPVPPAAGTDGFGNGGRPPTGPDDPLAELGWDDRWDETAARYGDGRSMPGRIVRADRGRSIVATAGGPTRAALLHPDVTTGDWVLLDPAGPPTVPATAVRASTVPASTVPASTVPASTVPASTVPASTVRAVLPRRTALVRGGGRKDAHGQLLAANVDVALITVPLTSAPNAQRLDRLLAVAWSSGARPVIALTKADLSRTADSERDEVLERAPGAPVVLTSTVDGRGLAELRAELAPGRTLAMLGVSGAGKSSLVNALAGAEIAGVAPIRPDGKGRHTTTARELVVLPGLGVLIDTPGLRGVQLWAAEDGLDQSFTDIVELTRLCRFRDCQHRTEPGCAVLAAVEEGRLAPRRLESFLRLHRENDWLQRRYDARLRAEQRRRWRAEVYAARRGRTRP